MPNYVSNTNTNSLLPYNFFLEPTQVNSPHLLNCYGNNLVTYIFELTAGRIMHAFLSKVESDQIFLKLPKFYHS